MALKTDSLRLKNYADVAERNTSIPSPDDGEIAITGGVLQIYDSSWANVSSGGGGGGASELAQLNDVSSSPTTQYDVGFVNASSELDFQPLLTTLTDSNALYIESQFADDNTHLMTARAIKNKIESYGYATSSDFITHAQFGSAGIMATDGAGNYSVVTNNAAAWDSAVDWGDHGDEGYAKNYTWLSASQLTENVSVPEDWTNQKFVMMGDPNGYKFAFANSASLYTDNTVIEIINHSDYNQTISTGGAHSMYLTNTQSQGTADIVIERGQRALILPKPANNLFFVSILVA